MTDEPANVPAPVKAPRQYVTVHSETALFDTAKFEQIARVASAAYRSSFLPEHLRKDGDTWLEPEGVQANCFVIASLAYDFGVGFMPLAQCISMVHGKTMYEGKFIAALIEKRLGTRLRYTYSGDAGTDGYGVKVWTDQDASLGYEPIAGTVGEWATKEKGGGRKSIWVGPNKQKMQLAYMGARVWCRLNAPGLIIGIYGDDEFDDVAAVPATRAPSPQITAGFAPAAAPAIEHKAAVVVGIDMASKPDKHVEATVNQAGHVQVVDEIGDTGVITKTAAEIDKSADKQPAAKRTRKAAPVEEAPTEPAGEQQPEASPPGPPASPPPPAPPPPAAPPTFEQIAGNLMDVMRPMKSWPKLKETLVEFIKTPEWKNMAQAQRNHIFASVWQCASKLNTQGLIDRAKMEVSPDQDVTAYRCAIEDCDEAGPLEGLWAAITTSDSYKDQPQASQQALADATRHRIKQLKGAG